MANFEGLIRQALANRQAGDPAIRQRIYQSSRNALANMLKNSGNITEQAAASHWRQLETSIARIEAEFGTASARPGPASLSPMPPPAGASIPGSPQADQSGQSVPEQNQSKKTASLLTPSPAQSPGSNQIGAEMTASRGPAAAPRATDQMSDAYMHQSPQRQTPQFQDTANHRVPGIDTPFPAGPEQQGTPIDTNRIDAGQANNNPDFVDDIDDAPSYPRKPLMQRLWPILLTIAIVLVLAWIGYAIFSKMTGPTGATGSSMGQGGDARGSFLTLLDPNDLTALVTANRGSAELVTVQGQNMIRLKSLRLNGNEVSADPILINFDPGILRQLAGKRVTVEIRARTQSDDPTLIAVECYIDGQSICGRKRFPIGFQPDGIVFYLDLTGAGPQSQVSLALNTDMTEAAMIAGEGKPIDIMYVRLLLPEN